VSGRSRSSRMTREPATARIKVWIDSVSSATLPLLGGFSTTAVIVVSDDAANFRWPGATIPALVIAAVVLILAVQFSYHARIYLSEWSDRKDKESLVASQGTSGDTDVQRTTQSDFYCKRGLFWARWTRRAYDCGLVALLAGLGLAVVPHHVRIEFDFKWFPTFLAFAACIFEVAWILRDPMRRYEWVKGE
jgi:hypothetical protein